MKTIRLVLVAASMLCVSRPVVAMDDSLSIKIGQMLMIGFRGLEIDRSSDIADDITRYHLGGVILFDYDVEQRRAKRNIASHGQVEKLTRDLQSFAGIPLFIAIDQEGGRVARLKKTSGFPVFPSQAELGRSNDTARTAKAGHRMGTLLRSLGINLNFAPVVDVEINPDNPVIGRLERSYSAEAALVTAQARAALRGMHQGGVLCAIKHFPGHGSSRGDSHEGFVDVSDCWLAEELLPFAALTHEGAADMVMTAHIFNDGLDPNVPATLSHTIVTGLLRDSLGFEGPVVSDDMQMKAIRDYYGLERALELAVNAGVDILLFANNTGVFEAGIAARVHGILMGLVDAGRITRDRIEDAWQRIMKSKSVLQ